MVDGGDESLDEVATGGNDDDDGADEVVDTDSLSTSSASFLLVSVTLCAERAIDSSFFTTCNSFLIALMSLVNMITLEFISRIIVINCDISLPGETAIDDGGAGLTDEVVASESAEVSGIDGDTATV